MNRPSDLGYYLKKKRTQLLLTQDRAAEEIGVSRVYYSSMENNKIYSYHPETVKSIARFLGKSTDWVLRAVPKEKEQ